MSAAHMLRQCAAQRLAALSPLTHQEVAAITENSGSQLRFRAGDPMGPSVLAERFLVLSGWVSRSKSLPRGEQQIIGYYLPGDVIQTRRGWETETTLAAIDDVLLMPAPASAGLRKAYDAAHALERSYVQRQIVRLGRMTAFERILDWMLEMRSRLSAAGVGDPDVMKLPLTQEALADTLGLTPIHTNRTLRALRESRILAWRYGSVHWLEDAESRDTSS